MSQRALVAARQDARVRVLRMSADGTKPGLNQQGADPRQSGDNRQGT